VNVLPWLAWALSVDHWDNQWLEQTQRQVIRDSIAVHQSKGTRSAIQNILVAAGYGSAVIIEGSDDIDPQAHWATWRIRMEKPLTVDQGTRIRQMLAHVAPARCQLKQIEFEKCYLYDGTICYDGEYTHGTHGTMTA
jgi:phage tail P2-like protein